MTSPKNDAKEPQDASPDTAATARDLDADLSDLSYEDAREQLVEIVKRLEQGNAPLEESLALWERGEALARRCQAWLDGARTRLQAAQVKRETLEDES